MARSDAVDEKDEIDPTAGGRSAKKFPELLCRASDGFLSGAAWRGNASTDVRVGRTATTRRLHLLAQLTRAHRMWREAEEQGKAERAEEHDQFRFAREPRWKAQARQLRWREREQKKEMGQAGEEQEMLHSTMQRMRLLTSDDDEPCMSASDTHEMEKKNKKGDDELAGLSQNERLRKLLDEHFDDEDRRQMAKVQEIVHPVRLAAQHRSEADTLADARLNWLLHAEEEETKNPRWDNPSSSTEVTPRSSGMQKTARSTEDAARPGRPARLPKRWAGAAPVSSWTRIQQLRAIRARYAAQGCDVIG